MSQTNSDDASSNISFEQLSLRPEIFKAIQELGYESPSPIQQSSIPVLQSGADLIGMAQTGTGKTAAFALPTLGKVDLENSNPQVLVLAPTRELAIQVAEAFKSYAKHLEGFRVLPIYGGQSFSVQLKQLKRGPHVIVGTPGRIMDHMRKGKLIWDDLHTLVLDEADEMLRMGFIEDVEWILEQTPESRQVALFSATMPKEIRRVADQFLKEPQEIKIKTKTTTAVTIEQQYLMVSQQQKLDVLTRILEVEETDAVIIFVRTKTATLEVAEKLNARGYSAAAINGDLQQAAREQTIERLKNGKLDILVATDVAARGLDVQRISHVVNYDITQDVESYVHRIGRTGRAGREGKAILFVTPREKRMLALIERVTKKKVERIGLPSTEAINDQRVEKFKLSITEKIDSGDLDPYLEILQDYQYESSRTGIEIAAALASLAHDSSPLLLEDLPSPKENRRERRENDSGNYGRERKHKRKGHESRDGKDFNRNAEKLEEFPEIEMERFVVMAGFQDGIKPGNVVGAIANEIEIESRYIGHIKIYDDFSTVDLPQGMPKSTLTHLKKVRVCGKPMRLTKAKDFDESKGVPKGEGDKKRKNVESRKGRNNRSDKKKKGKQ
ncbi:DEAD/DEAH box helicase [Aliikangiella sp. G2MR2-5]|uniref:DEAD/DEAH box helicase n=1 Tax=Aliikangiella sp. G2MR2-5 TaxID=2788943 RepID=UPI0018AB2CC9|nr:DEAD/DEAH box helicase [Aliikangiella sp. G2MR2-5]